MIFNRRFCRSSAMMRKRRVSYTKRVRYTLTHTHTHPRDMYTRVCACGIIGDILFCFLKTPIEVRTRPVFLHTTIYSPAHYGNARSVHSSGSRIKYDIIQPDCYRCPLCLIICNIAVTICTVPSGDVSKRCEVNRSSPKVSVNILSVSSTHKSQHIAGPPI